MREVKPLLSRNFLQRIIKPIGNPLDVRVSPTHRMLGGADNEGLDNGLHDRKADQDIKNNQFMEVEIHFIGDGASSASRTVTYVSAAR